MPVERLARYMLLSKGGDNWKMGRGGHSLTWEKRMRALTGGLARVGTVGSPDGMAGDSK